MKPHVACSPVGPHRSHWKKIVDGVPVGVATALSLDPWDAVPETIRTPPGPNSGATDSHVVKSMTLQEVVGEQPVVHAGAAVKRRADRSVDLAVGRVELVVAGACVQEVGTGAAD